jgi:hypothetical protein
LEFRTDRGRGNERKYERRERIGEEKLEGYFRREVLGILCGKGKK